ncbi:hypothetical protein D046_0590B, partial [Vibrio parahaemolyticus V-223/04]
FSRQIMTMMRFLKSSLKIVLIKR